MCDRCRLWHHLIVWFAGKIWILSRQSRSMVATLSFSFAATLALLIYQGQYVNPSRISIDQRTRGTPNDARTTAEAIAHTSKQHHPTSVVGRRTLDCGGSLLK
ncbi:hypothetical protein BLNAU_10483 [Blattamonas nauphoetae]|uniref:Secreted protein n=1 Tax=Blattamonas nauphoetae TaxID=2049346 RepID=A0ABQ9XSA0_9EUKA|nr:hypothetical protein BLNAU_10483 [Blattamonas nauphoetae]